MLVISRRLGASHWFVSANGLTNDPGKARRFSSRDQADQVIGDMHQAERSRYTVRSL